MNIYVKQCKVVPTFTRGRHCCVRRLLFFWWSIVGSFIIR